MIPPTGVTGFLIFVSIGYGTLPTSIIISLFTLYINHALPSAADTLSAATQ